MTSEFRNDDDDDAIFPMAWGPIVFEELGIPNSLRGLEAQRGLLKFEVI